MAKTSKEIEIGEKKFKLNYPSIGLSSEADMEYSKAFTNALTNGLKPQVLMEKTLRDSGLWTLEDDKSIDSLTKDLQDSIVKIMGLSDDLERERERANFYSIQNALLKVTIRKQSLTNHTAEQKGEEAKITYLCWNCILNLDGTKYWKSKDDLMKEQDQDLVKRAIQEFISFTSGLEEKMNSIEAILSGDLENKEVEKEEIKETIEEIKTEVVATLN